MYIDCEKERACGLDNVGGEKEKGYVERGGENVR